MEYSIVVVAVAVVLVWNKFQTVQNMLGIFCFVFKPLTLPRVLESLIRQFYRFGWKIEAKRTTSAANPHVSGKITFSVSHHLKCGSLNRNKKFANQMNALTHLENFQ